jgi:hypothetical protein
VSTAPPTARTCGACTFCCKVFRIDALDKPADAWCPHCKVGAGCTVYASRPQECRDFACQWLDFEQLPDSFRPDRCKVVLSIEPPGAQLVARCDPANPLAWRNEPVYGFLKRYVRQAWGSSLHVYARAGPRLWLITPKEDVDLGHVETGAPLSISEGADGRVRVTVQPPPGRAGGASA